MSAIRIAGGIRCPAVRFETFAPPNRERALFRVRKALPEIVWNTTALEGNPMTYPEVQTLLEGVTVGGHRIEDAQQVLNQARAWNRLVDLVEAGRFAPGADVACELQALVAEGEALECGRFRTGRVGIGGTDYEPPAHETLPDLFRAAAEDIGRIDCPATRSMCWFLAMARAQFFWDGNKRTGRLMMNGILLSAGRDAVCVPNKRRLEFNRGMIAFYDSGDAEPMLDFLASCSLDGSLARSAPGHGHGPSLEC